MGYTLKLNIYCLSLRKKRSQRDDLSTFGDFFVEAFSQNRTEEKGILFSRFLDQFQNSFEDKFVLNYDRTKGIAINSINKITEWNTIDGMIVGGLTGVEQDVYDMQNSSDKEDTIDKDKVTALPYYFKLWMPFDSSIGVLMIQSYTEAGVTSLLANKVKAFFSSLDYMIDSAKFVDKEYKERFKKRSEVQKLSLFKSHLSEDTRHSLNQIFTEFEGLQVKIEITGFKISIDEFLNSVRTNNIVNADLSDLGMQDNNYDVIATYKDESGLQSQARLSKNFDVFPTIILDSDLKEDGKEYPNYEKIRSHTNKILEKVKKEIEYAPEDMD